MCPIFQPLEQYIQTKLPWLVHNAVMSLERLVNNESQEMLSLTHMLSIQLQRQSPPEMQSKLQGDFILMEGKSEIKCNQFEVAVDRMVKFKSRGAIQGPFINYNLMDHAH